MIDPRVRLALVACVGLLAIALERPLALAALALACALPLLALRPPARWWARGLALVASVVWGTCLSQSLFWAEQPRVPLATLGPLTFWREGALHGLAQSLRLVALALAGLTLTRSTPPDRLFAALLALRLPFGLALMTATALRFLPEIGRELATVRRARAHRGRPLRQRGPLAWLLLELGLLRPVVARSWRRAQSLAESLDARGFDPLAPRAVRRPLRAGARDALLLALAGGLTLAVLLARGLFALYTRELLYAPALRGLYGFTRAWL